MRKISLLLYLIALSLVFPNVAHADAASDADAQVVAKSAILVEQETGKVLYSRHENAKMYPASMTKILTALVALDYLTPDEVVVAGSEVYAVPEGSSKAGHFNGESLKVENLIRGLIIPSGNESACVVARAVASKIQPGAGLSYEAAEKLFCDLMNEKAIDLGAKNTHFVNPHGYHEDNHYTTAADMALFARAAMENELIRKIAAERTFDDNGAGEAPDPILKTKEYNWKTHNELIGDGEYAYPYATGIKTGFTDEAGNCLAASATKESVSLIAIVFDSPDSGRWTDCVTLFDYGFATFAYYDVQTPGTIIDTVQLANTRLGEEDTLEVVAKGSSKQFLSEEELGRIQRTVTFDGRFLLPAEEGDDRRTQVEGIVLAAPIEKNAIVGEVTYTLDGETIFTDKLLSTRGDIAERTFKSDVKYYFDKVKKAAFSLRAIPFWIGGVVLIALVFIIIRRIIRRRRHSYYTFRRRY